MKIKFICPNCGSDMGIEEVLGGLTQYSVLSDVTNGEYIEYDEYDDGPTYDGGSVDRYQCRECGWAIPIEPTEQDLIRWLKENSMLEGFKEEERKDELIY